MFDYLSPADQPVVDGLEEHEVVYAKDQPEYIPLRALRSNAREGRVLSRWTLTPEQREAVADGADVFLELMTFGKALQPIRMAIGDQPSPFFISQEYGFVSSSIAQPNKESTKMKNPFPKIWHAIQHAFTSAAHAAVVVGHNLAIAQTGFNLTIQGLVVGGVISQEDAQKLIDEGGKIEQAAQALSDAAATGGDHHTAAENLHSALVGFEGFVESNVAVKNEETKVHIVAAAKLFEQAIEGFAKLAPHPPAAEAA